MKMIKVIQEPKKDEVLTIVYQVHDHLFIMSDGRIVYDGLYVPYFEDVEIDIDPSGNKDKNIFKMELDRRYGGHIIGDANFQQFIWLCTNAMAISKGYSCFGRGCRPTDEFNQWFKPDGIDPIEQQEDIGND
jgi:hypothetical protein